MPTKAKPVAKINKSAKTGKIVTKQFADENPDTTFATKKKAKANVEVKIETPKSKAAPKPKVPAAPKGPQIGKTYLFTSAAGEFIGTLSEGEHFPRMTIHEVVNNVKTERTIDVPDVSVYGFKELDKDELFRRLA